MFVTKQELNAALGTFKEKKEKDYYAGMCQLFKPMNVPNSGDWLYSHKEVHQAYDNYKLPYYNKVTPERMTIYLQEFGEFNQDFIKSLCKFCELFYPKLLVKCLPVLKFETELSTIKKRKNIYGDQYLAQDILAYMEKRVPKDAYCVMGITLKDIYPGDSWNFVYGWAKYKARVGIFSFLRWDDEFAEGNTKEINWNEILYPSMRTMVHEIGHMFGITHCVYYRCLMNGFNHIEENYLNPLEFCPICFRKIITNIGFDRTERYKDLISYCKSSNLKPFKKDELFYSELLGLSSKYLQKPEKVQKKFQISKNNVRQPLKRPQVNTNNRGKSLQVGVKRR